MNQIETSPGVYQLTPLDPVPNDEDYCHVGVCRIFGAAIAQAAKVEPEWFDSDEYARLFRFMTGRELTEEALHSVKLNYGLVKEVE